MRRPQNLKKSPTGFGKTAGFNQQRQNKWAIFSKFCGLFRKAGLYAKMFDNENPPIRIENKNPQIKEFNGAEKTLVSQAFLFTKIS